MCTTRTAMVKLGGGEGERRVEVEEAGIHSFCLSTILPLVGSKVTSKVASPWAREERKKGRREKRVERKKKKGNDC